MSTDSGLSRWCVAKAGFEVDPSGRDRGGHGPDTAAALAAAGTAARAPAPAAPRPALRIAVLAPEYPKVSHTFIRREIQALERLGHAVLRLSIRVGTTIDPADRDERARTICCLGLPRARLVGAVLLACAARPRWLLRALRAALRMHRASDRGLLRHLAYLAEAAALLRVCAAHDIRHVHAHFGTNAAAVARLMRCLSGNRLAYSMTVHGPEEFDAPRALSLPDKVADAAFVVAISDHGAAQLRRWSRTAHWHKIH